MEARWKNRCTAGQREFMSEWKIDGESSHNPLVSDKFDRSFDLHFR